MTGMYLTSRRDATAGLIATVVTLRPAAAATNPAEPAAAPRDAPAEPRIVLTASAIRDTIVPGAAEPADLWVFDGLGPVPVVRVRHGEELFVRLVNATPAPLSLHWHGVRAPNGSDGVGGLTQAPAPPGASFDYRFTPPDAGTFLVRPLVLGGAGEAAGRGLSALLVVDEKEPPKVESEVAVVVRDWLTQPDGALAPFGGAAEAALGGRLGNRLIAGGVDVPRRIEVQPGSRTRIRLANGCNARIMRVSFAGMKVYVAAVDGQPAGAFEPLRSSLPFPPGTRYDLIVDAPDAPGTTGSITALIGAGLPLVTLATAAGEPAARTRPPEPLGASILAPNAALPAEIKLQNAVRRDIVIAGGAKRSPSGEPVFTGDPKAIWTLNGAAGSLGAKPILTARRGQPVVIGITNATGFPQPMHLHGHVFRLLHPLDDGWEPYWLDTLQVAEGKTVHIAFLADNPGKWLLGSTVLERLDTGLWTWFEVT